MRRSAGILGILATVCGTACGGGSVTPSSADGGKSSTNGTGGATSGGAPPQAGANGSAGNANAGGGKTSTGAGGSTTSASGGATNGAGGSASAAGGSTAGSSSGVGGAVSVSCGQASAAYTLKSVALDASIAPHIITQGWGASLSPQVPVAVNPNNGDVYVGLTRDVGGTLSAQIVNATSGAPTPVVNVAGASLAGLAVTNNGFGMLLFDPNDNIDARTWAAVGRFGNDGSKQFTTDLFRSANLTDANTKGAPATARFGYSASNDQLIAYFSHTEMIQSVRHQGGYLATLNATGTQTLVSGWWGSHNLDQRLVVAGAQVGLLGLGDAYPKGVFFSFLVSKPNARVIYTLAGNGQGTTNGQLGGLVDLDDVLAAPFVTNESISQTLTPGDWPNIDMTIADQISQAAANGNKLGLLLVPKAGALPSGNLTPVWLDPALASGAHIERVKAARYGAGALLLLTWAEAAGSGRNVTRNYFTMVVDKTGAVCQPKTPVTLANAPTASDDLVQRPDGSIVWANVTSNRISLMTLTPG